MAVYESEREPVVDRDGRIVYSEERVVRRSGGIGRILLALIVLVAIVVAALFATGFWTADVKEGALPVVDVRGGELPAVDVQSKKVVVGTRKETVDVPTVQVTDQNGKTGDQGEQ